MAFEDLFKNAGNFTEDDVKGITQELGFFQGRDFNNDKEEWDDDMLNAYAEYIKNYWYTYKDAATEIDPTIDPEEEHYGPMAQDIEKVNPACVKETPEGVKTVDAARLAMMNSGIIADVIRRLFVLEMEVDKLKGGNNG